MSDRETTPARLRLFIALPAPEPVRAAAVAAADGLRGAGDVRWVAPRNLHLTLRFLGDTAPELVPTLEAELERIANNFSLFVLELGGPGAFPGVARPRTLWLAVREEPVLLRLAEAVESAMRGLGFPPEAWPYRAHLTLGRVRSPRGLTDLSRKLRERVSEEGTEAGPRAGTVCWPVEEFQLVRSDLRPGGPEYTTLRRFALRRETAAEVRRGPETPAGTASEESSQGEDDEAKESAAGRPA